MGKIKLVWLTFNLEKSFKIKKIHIVFASLGDMSHVGDLFKYLNVIDWNDKKGTCNLGVHQPPAAPHEVLLLAVFP